MRQSLAKGAAQDACRRARAEEADLASAFHALSDLAPNRKAAERIVSRLRQTPGVVLGGLVAGQKARVVLILRTAPQAILRGLTEEDFLETSVIYTRIETWAAKGAVHHLLYRVTVSPHALQRLVERSACPLGPGLLATLDAEVRPLFRGLRTTEVEVGEKLYVRSDACKGLWVGCVAQSAADEDWGLVAKDEGMPTLAIRTFLDVEHMSPVNYLRWKGDPTLTVQ